jgi:hypothetical protein
VNFGLKRLQFTWNVGGIDADVFRFFENPDGVSGFTQVGPDLNYFSFTFPALDIAVHRHNWANARYLVEACNSLGCTASNERTTSAGMLQTIGYFKASNTEANDVFGESISLSADGNTLAVAAVVEASAATGINGNQVDNSAPGAGAVYVFTRSGATWSQQAYIKPSNTQANDFFGESISLSADGNTLAVGADGEASAATGINGNQADNSAFLSGAVYVYTQSSATWPQQAYVKASNTETADLFGHTVALNADGNTLAVGAIFEASAATGIGNGNQFYQADNSAPSAGAVYLY